MLYENEIQSVHLKNRSIDRVIGGWTVHDFGQCHISEGVWKSSYDAIKGYIPPFKQDVFPTLEEAISAALTK